jgi:mannose-1-phosphate guanylyltransferase/mannose-6-phosphate isomerase
MITVHPVVLCGGAGERLWPASKRTVAKPFLDLFGGGRSLFQDTVSRVSGVTGAAGTLIVAGHSDVGNIQAQLRALNVAAELLVEPVGRDSAPAIIAAALWLARIEPRAVALVVASDHYIPDHEAFRASVLDGLPAAGDGAIVTFGVQPTYPATGYGYIHPGERIAREDHVRRVERFVEKPDATTARAFVDAGYLWNSGNFLFRVDTFLAQARRHVPEMVGAVEAAIEEARTSAGRGGQVVELGPRFAQALAQPVDIAVMEKADNVCVLPIEFDWSDLGSWDAVHGRSTRDAQGNVHHGRILLEDCEDCFVRADADINIIANGLRDLVVVAHDRNILVSSTQKVALIKPAVRKVVAQHGAVQADVFTPGDLKPWMWRKALPLWLSFGLDRVNGGFHESLLPDLTSPGEVKRARVNARQTYVFAVAGKSGWPGPWESAVTQGLNFFRTRFRREDGLVHGAVDPAGHPVTGPALLYDQAFSLLALAAAADVEVEPAATLKAEARALFAAISRTFGHLPGGFVAREDAPVLLANPLMHLFEAMIACRGVDPGGPWADGAEQIATLFIERLFDARLGAIRESFDADWRPAAGLAGRILEPGHQFEWAWLVHRWGGEGTTARSIARTLFRTGERGVDARSGLVHDELLDDFSVHKASSRLWPQTERLRTAQALGETAAARGAARAIGLYLKGPMDGLWSDAPHVESQAGVPSPASTLYHLIGPVVASD